MNNVDFSDTHIVRALYDFDALHDDDLSFKKDDKLDVEERKLRKIPLK